MDLALYAPGGYFEGAPVGTGGDFVTSPHVHPVFAEHLARAIRELHDGLGRPTPLRIAEAGAGDGTLARLLIEALGELPVDYVGVERSAAGRASLGHVAGVRASTSLPDAPHVVVANELLDNLPFRRIRRRPRDPRGPGRRPSGRGRRPVGGRARTAGLRDDRAGGGTRTRRRARAPALPRLRVAHRLRRTRHLRRACPRLPGASRGRRPARRPRRHRHHVRRRLRAARAARRRSWARRVPDGDAARSAPGARVRGLAPRGARAPAAAARTSETASRRCAPGRDGAAPRSSSTRRPSAGCAGCCWPRPASPNRPGSSGRGAPVSGLPACDRVSGRRLRPRRRWIRGSRSGRARACREGSPGSR